MMRTAMKLMIGAAALAPLAGAATAQDRVGSYAHTAIMQGDFVKAEASLRADQRIFPHRPEVLLNLATIYARTGRADAARELYNRVLAEKPVDLTLANDGVASSYDLARSGLSSLDMTQPVQFTSR